MKSSRIAFRFGSLALLAGGLIAGSPSLAIADITLPSIISNHMVLQRSNHTRVWGKAAPSEKINLTLGDLHGETVADADGNWKIALDLSHAKEGPFDMVIEGANKITVADVLVGEVWLCSGQSNMAYSLTRSTGGAEEIARSANPRLRQFTVSYNPVPEPQEKCKGVWMVADPTTAPDFSAVSYYFAKSIQKAMNTPVGIVRSAWAGSPIMNWISETALSAEPELKEMNDLTKQRIVDYPKLKEAYVADIADWETKTNRKDHPGDPAAFADPGIREDDWKKASLHNTRLKALGLPDAGAVWFRKKVVLPASNSSNPSSSLNLIVGAFDQTYLNGKKIGEMTEATCPGPSAMRTYKIPGDFLKEGENVVAVRVFTPTEAASFGSAYIDVGIVRTQLTGEWLAKTEFELPPLTDKSYPQLPGAPGTRPSYLYNGMINPITPYTFAGVVWYQGEQDSGSKGSQYKKLLEALIGDWRARLGAQLPFCLCQLPNYGAKVSTPKPANWPNIREAQRRALEVPGTSLVTLIDLGDEDVHPPDKKPVGERVALSALATAYGQKIPYSGPIYESMKVDGSKAVISFRFADGGLMAKPLPADYLPTFAAKEKIPLVRNSPESELEGFSICGEDNKWVWAQAKIDGATVVVWSPAVPKPVAVRYAWADNPTCNLYNGAGLPASPFQTDELK